MKKVLLTSFALFMLIMIGSKQLAGQENLIVNQIREQLSDDDIKKLDQVDVLYKEGDQFMRDASNTKRDFNNLSDRKKRKRKGKKLKAKENKYRIQGHEKYGEANKIKFNIYAKNLDILKTKAGETNKEEAMSIENEANKHFQEAKKLRQKAQKADQDQAVKLLAEAHETELLSIEEQEIAFDIYLNWGSIEAQLVEPTTETTATGFDENGQPIPSNGSESIEDFQSFSNNDNNNNEGGEFNENYSNESDPNFQGSNMSGGEFEEKRFNVGIVFKVQIIAVSKALTEPELKSIYDADQYISNREGNLIKYLIGEFRTYEEAKSLRDKIRQKVPGAFVVAFKDGKKISVQTAISKTSGQ